MWHSGCALHAACCSISTAWLRASSSSRRPMASRPTRMPTSGSCRWASSRGWRSSRRSIEAPGAVLTPQEVNDLFITLRRMVQEGHSLVLISHKLHEVMAISDRITVLRDGIVIGTRRTSEVTRDELVKMMVGRELKEVEPRPLRPGPVRLKVDALQV